MRTWIGLGGNREDSAGLLGAALAGLAATPRVTLLRRSRLYRSPPWGVTDQPDFVNAVAEFETDVQPLPWLAQLAATEDRLGRRRQAQQWGPRCVDLDLLTYGDLRITSDELVLPHPRMHQRAFVLVPLLELEPDFVIPGIGSAADCLRDIDPREVSGVVPLERTDSEEP